MPDVIHAVIADDMRSVGLAYTSARGDRAVLIGRFIEPVPPQEWRRALTEEWPEGDGAVVRAILRMEALGYKYEGNFDPPVDLDPGKGQILGREESE